MAGAESKCTPEVVKLAEELAEIFTTDKDIAEAIGVHPGTICAWKNPNNEFYHREFSEALKRGKAKGRAYHRRKIVEAEQWQSSAWWLERTEPESFGNKLSLEHSGSMAIGVEKLTDEQLRRIAGGGNAND